jgi:hypothetical protein
MTTRNVTDRITPWVEATIDAVGDEVAGWCCTPIPQPPPVVIALALMVWVPAAHELGAFIVGQQVFDSPPNLDEPTVTGAVRELLEALRNMRSEALRQSQAAQNGNPPPSGPGGLTLVPRPPQGPS